MPGPSPLAATAASLLEFLQQDARGVLLFVVAQDRRARALHAALKALQPDGRFALFPEWDVLPFDRLAPSPSVVGIRMGALRWLTDLETPPALVVTTPAAILRKVPPRCIWPRAHVSLEGRQQISPEDLQQQLTQIGYLERDIANQPGEMAIHGQTIDVFPAAAPMPCRILHEDGRIAEIRSYDPVTQGTQAPSDRLIVDPAAEISIEQSPLESIFDYAPGCRLILEDDAEQRARVTFGLIKEAAETKETGDLFLTPEQWMQEKAKRHVPDWAVLPHEIVPLFAREKDAGRALVHFVRAQRREGHNVLLTGEGDSLAILQRRLRRETGDIGRVRDWKSARETPRVNACEAPIERGVTLPSIGISIVAAGDFLGSRVALTTQKAQGDSLITTDMRIGDIVVHEDHGLAILKSLETLDVPDDGQRDMLRLEYGDEVRQIVPVEDIGLVWRYGGDQEAVKLDRLDRDTWAQRKQDALVHVAKTAQRLMEVAQDRLTRRAPRIEPPLDTYEEIAGRFPYALTSDQASAINATLEDLASGKPMERLVCGDVGYGKTEVAVRAAAAAALAGYQVAILAPTTLLARQHFRLFCRRFAGMNVTIHEMSRLTGAAETKAARAALRQPCAAIIVGTHAILSKTIRFARLGLVVIDEEQKFGTRHKQQARALARDIHMLSMTATPIPRTLAAGLVGLVDLSVIATPPHLRLPVRTSVIDPSPELIRDALMREKRRGGQSFYICPRIEGMQAIEADLHCIVPELRVLVAHGRMKPADMDAAMLAFAEGEGDVLLATGIVENGLDVPRANTIVVHEAGRFGMAQLHQLRGRVGRGSRRAFAYFLTHAGKRWRSAEKRLNALANLDHLGAGFSVSARDLDLRGAGDLLGEDQAGHVHLIGVGLYQEMLTHALAVARGEERMDRMPAPEFNLGLAGRIPADYVPDPDLRISLYRSIAAIDDPGEAESCAASMADRFGPLPEETEALLAAARLRPMCRALGIRRLDAGPAGIAATMSPADAALLAGANEGWTCSGDRLVLKTSSDNGTERFAMIESFVEAIADALEDAPVSGP